MYLAMSVVRKKVKSTSEVQVGVRNKMFSMCRTCNVTNIRVPQKPTQYGNRQGLMSEERLFLSRRKIT